MFEENNIGIELSDPEIFFLAEELNLERLVGFSLDYESLSKELKIQLKQESYKLLEEKNILQMDFSGNASVDSRFANIVKQFENPQKVIVWQYHQKKDNTSQLRKAFICNDSIIALDYFMPAVSNIYRLKTTDDVKKFIQADYVINNISNNEVCVNTIKVEDIVDKSSDYLMLSFFAKDNDGYVYTENVYAKIDEIWYEVKKDNNYVELRPVEKELRVLGNEE